MKTVGQILSSARKKKKWTLDDVHKFTKIQPKYIKALENGDYDVFSGRVHTKGFLKNYAEFLELDLNEVMAFWRREYEADYQKRTNKKAHKSFQLTKIEFPKVTLSAKLIVSMLSLILVIGFFSYLFYQYKSYAANPEIDIVSPLNNIVTDQSLIDITGSTEADSELFLNNQRVVLGLDGGFATTIKLNPGINSLNFSVKNRLGRTSRKVLTVIYRPDETAQSNDSAVLPAFDALESTQSTSSLELSETNPQNTLPIETNTEESDNPQSEPDQD